MTKFPSRLMALSVAVLLVLAACAPATTIAPEQLIVDMPYEQAFNTVVTTISTQPYPSNKGGWVIVTHDQTGGILVAEMNYTTYQFLAAPRPVKEQVSIALTNLGDRTAVNIGVSSGDEAGKLAVAIREALTN